MFYDFFTQAVAVDVGINLRSSDALMSQHTLNGTQIRTAFQQMSGKRMAKGMGAYAFLQPDLIRQFLYNMKHHNTRNVLAEVTYKYIIFESGLYHLFSPDKKIIVQLADGSRRDGHKALLVSLSFYFYEAFVQI